MKMETNCFEILFQLGVRGREIVWTEIGDRLLCRQVDICTELVVVPLDLGSLHFFVVFEKCVILGGDVFEFGVGQVNGTLVAFTAFIIWNV